MQAQTFLNYKGDRSNMQHPQAMGPNTLGEVLYTVSAEYDPETDRTRVGLTWVKPEVTA